MRILVVGAGAIGGYFGARLLHAGRDVTFLVRKRRANELAETGLVVKSRFGDISIELPPLVLAEDLNQHFDLILVSCKAYDLEGAIESFAPAVGPETMILPLLNGMAHMDVLDRRFDPEQVLGGHSHLASTLDDKGRIVHLNDVHSLTFGERGKDLTTQMAAVQAVLANANFEEHLSTNIMQELWEKRVFIAGAAGILCLMRAAVGDVVAAGGIDLIRDLLEECASIAAANGFPPRPAAIERNKVILTAAGSTLTASMLRDIERGARTEGDHILGDLLRRSPPDSNRASLLHIAFTHVQAYEERRRRESAGFRPDG
jgi:2-dehydropantoate 2-reductase